MSTSASSSKRSVQGGFSLLEVMVAIGILSLVMLMTFASMKSATDVSAVENTRNRLDRKGAKALDTMSKELRSASVLGVAGNGTVLVFQKPVDLDGNGTVLDKTGEPEFGIDDVSPPATGAINFQFVPNNALSVGPMNEALLRRDLNGDGDRLDVFDRGRIMRATTLWAVQPRQLSGYYIVQPRGNWGGDIDGDGAPDPIFRINGKQVFMDLWMIAVDASGMQHLVRCQTSVQCRN
ncbi:MAG: prepilin-type N-terminal cleavage/methylation domain-containing protein [Planctomycetota bacterium]|jgi:prepilin-type N-terminal cleavage/methylation domain-containing protein